MRGESQEARPAYLLTLISRQSESRKNPDPRISSAPSSSGLDLALPDTDCSGWAFRTGAAAEVAAPAAPRSAPTGREAPLLPPSAGRSRRQASGFSDSFRLEHRARRGSDLQDLQRPAESPDPRR